MQSTRSSTIRREVITIWLQKTPGHVSCLFFQAEDGIRDLTVTGVQTCALPILKLADAYGIPGWRVERAGDLEPVLARASAEPGPALVEFVIEQEANVFPMIPPGATPIGRASCRERG